jgi:hypothetical protein
MSLLPHIPDKPDQETRSKNTACYIRLIMLYIAEQVLECSSEEISAARAYDSPYKATDELKNKVF